VKAHPLSLSLNIPSLSHSTAGAQQPEHPTRTPVDLQTDKSGKMEPETQPRKPHPLQQDTQHAPSPQNHTSARGPFYPHP
jgi:hypothetical protein